MPSRRDFLKMAGGATLASLTGVVKEYVPDSEVTIEEITPAVDNAYIMIFEDYPQHDDMIMMMQGIREWAEYNKIDPNKFMILWGGPIQVVEIKK